MRSRAGGRWSEADENTLRQMAEQNASPLRIAARVNRTTRGVKMRAAQLGIPLPRIRSGEQQKSDKR